MQLVLARRRSDAEEWAKKHGHTLKLDWRRTRSDSTLYVHLADQLRGRTLTDRDTVIVLNGFADRANAEQIMQSIEVASLADPAGGPSWETR